MKFINQNIVIIISLVLAYAIIHLTAEDLPGVIHSLFSPFLEFIFSIHLWQHNNLWCWRSIAQACMRPLGIVMDSPPFCFCLVVLFMGMAYKMVWVQMKEKYSGRLFFLQKS